MHFYSPLLKLVFSNNRKLFFCFLQFSILFLHGRLNMLIAKCGLCQLNLRCSILEIYLSTFPQYCLLVPTSVHLRLYVHLFLPKLMRVAFQKEHVQNRPADIEVWGRLCSSCLCQCIDVELLCFPPLYLLLHFSA